MTFTSTYATAHTDKRTAQYRWRVKRRKQRIHDAEIALLQQLLSE